MLETLMCTYKSYRFPKTSEQRGHLFLVSSKWTFSTWLSRSSWVGNTLPQREQRKFWLLTFSWVIKWYLKSERLVNDSGQYIQFRFMPLLLSAWCSCVVMWDIITSRLVNVCWQISHWKLTLEESWVFIWLFRWSLLKQLFKVKIENCEANTKE